MSASATAGSLAITTASGLGAARRRAASGLPSGFRYVLEQSESDPQAGSGGSDRKKSRGKGKGSNVGRRVWR